MTIETDTKYRVQATWADETALCHTNDGRLAKDTARHWARREARVTLYRREGDSWVTIRHFGVGRHQQWAEDQDDALERETKRLRRLEQERRQQQKRDAEAATEALERAKGRWTDPPTPDEEIHRMAEQAAGTRAAASVLGSVRSRGKYSRHPR